MEPQYETHGLPNLTLQLVPIVFGAFMTVVCFALANEVEYSVLGHNVYRYGDSGRETLIAFGVIMLIVTLFVAVRTFLENSHDYLKVYPDHLEGCCMVLGSLNEVRIEPQEIEKVEGRSHNLTVRAHGKRYDFPCGDGMRAYQLVSQMIQGGRR